MLQLKGNMSFFHFLPLHALLLVVILYSSPGLSSSLIIIHPAARVLSVSLRFQNRHVSVSVTLFFTGQRSNLSPGYKLSFRTWSSTSGVVNYLGLSQTAPALAVKFWHPERLVSLGQARAVVRSVLSLQFEILSSCCRFNSVLLIVHCLGTSSQTVLLNYVS